MKKLMASALLIALAACTSTTGGPSAVASPSSSSRPAATSAAPLASSPTSVCALVTKTDAETLVGAVTDAPVSTSAPAVPGVADQASACVYRGASGVLTVAVVDRSTSRADFDNVAKQVPGAQPVPGLGDAAYGASSGGGSAGGATVLVLKGSKFLSLSVSASSKSGDALLDALKTLARSAIAKL